MGKKVKKIFNLESANSDLKKRQDILKKTDDGINGLFNSINNNYNTMCITIPEDKKKGLAKEIKAVEEKLEVLGRFKGTVGKIEELVAALTAFDNSLKTLDTWKDAATAELKAIKEASGAMLPEERVARTMDLQEDIAAKLEILAANAKVELDLLPQGDKVPADAQLSRTSSRGSPTMSRSSRVTPRLSATSTPTMSSTGLSTGPASRSSTPGWLVLRSLPLRVCPSPPTWLRSRLLTTRSRHSLRIALTSSRSLRLPMELPRR